MKIDKESFHDYVVQAQKHKSLWIGLFFQFQERFRKTWYATTCCRHC